MKKVLFPTLLILISIFACKKETLLDPQDYFFYYTANGTEVTRDSIEFYADNLLTGKLTLDFNEDDKSLKFIINDYEGEGTYTDVFMEYYIGGQGYFGTGEVIVEEIVNEKFIKGSFSGDAEILGGTTPMAIADGSFVLKYSEF